MTDQEIVRRSVATVAKRMGYANPDILTQRDHDHIGDRIADTTGIVISGATIRRLLHGKFSRMPQIATLNAIAMHLGYKTWQEYKLLSMNAEEEAEVAARQLIAEPERRTQIQTANEGGRSPVDQAQNLKRRWRNIGAGVFAAVLLIVILIAGFVRNDRKPHVSNTSTAKFSVRKASPREIPATVVFNYDIENVQADSFFIQQSWDRNRRVRISRNSHILTDIYYEPGFHIAKLIANDSVIRTIDISIPTDGWFVFARSPGVRNVPEYISTNNKKNGVDDENNIADGSFTITETQLANNKVEPANDKEYVYSFFPEAVKVNSDDFTLKSRVRMKELGKNFCPYITIDVFTQRYTMFVKTMPRGCASEALLQFGDKVISGKDNDLTSLAFDVRQWLDIRISVINRKVKIFINGEQAFTTSYARTSNAITGLSFVSNGLCEIDYVSLKGNDGSVVYENDFNGKAGIGDLIQASSPR
jgi:hypothetical protein